MKLILHVLLLLALAACGTDAKVTEAMLAAHTAAQAQPTIQLRCPTGCEFAYTDPRDRQQFKAPTNGWDAITSLGQATIGLAQSTVAPLVIGGVALKGFEALKGSGAVTTTTTTNTTAPVTTTTTTIAPVITRTTTIGANSGDNSGNTTTTSTSNTSNTSTVGANSGANSGNSTTNTSTTNTSTSTSTSTNTSTTVGPNSGTNSGNTAQTPAPAASAP